MGEVTESDWSHGFCRRLRSRWYYLNFQALEEEGEARHQAVLVCSETVFLSRHPFGSRGARSLRLPEAAAQPLSRGRQHHQRLADVGPPAAAQSRGAGRCQLARLGEQN